MKITTFNCNGIRSAMRKGFIGWVAREQPDILCLQETKAQSHQLAGESVCPPGYYCYYADAQKKGYAGTAIFSRYLPDRVRVGFGWEPADQEGRFIQADFGRLSVISLYLPSGSSGEQRQAIKLLCLAQLLPLLEQFRRDNRHYVVCGDWNMCHQPIDLKNWRANRNKPGFLPEERAWLDNLYNGVGYVDAFRYVYPAVEQYSWWSSRGQARLNNVGWRLDYHVITPGLADHIRAVTIDSRENFSDHAPVTLELAGSLAEYADVGCQ